MYHSITFNSNTNTYTDWGLVPESRPLIAAPKRKTNYIDIPGANGSLDLSNVLTRYPVFNDREGSWTFYAIYNNRWKSEKWQERYSEILKVLDSRRVTHTVRLEDDPNYYYEGSVLVNKWESLKDYSKVTLDYRLFPYKYWRDLTTLTISPSGSGWESVYMDYRTLGIMPVSPLITTTGSVEVRLVNDMLAIDETVQLDQGTDIRVPGFIFSKTTSNPGMTPTIYVKGAGQTVTFKWRNGEL